VLDVEDWAEIRGLHRAEGQPIKVIARVMGISKNTVKAALASDGAPVYRRRPAGSIVDRAEPAIRPRRFGTFGERHEGGFGRADLSWLAAVSLIDKAASQAHEDHAHRSLDEARFDATAKDLSHVILEPHQPAR